MTQKIHWVGAGNNQGWANTACGMEAMVVAVEPTRYKGVNGNPLNAIYRSWEGVTCGSCLRNPHSPKGRLGAHSISSQERT